MAGFLGDFIYITWQWVGFSLQATVCQSLHYRLDLNVLPTEKQLQCVTFLPYSRPLQSLHPSVYLPLGDPSRIDSGLDHVTCFGQWDTSKCDINRNLKSASTMGLILSCGSWDLCSHHHVNLPRLVCWRHGTSFPLPQPTKRDSQHQMQTYEWSHPRPTNPQAAYQLTRVTWVSPDETSRRTTKMRAVQIADPRNHKLMSDCFRIKFCSDYSATKAKWYIP